MGIFLSIPILALAAALQATIIPQFSLLGGRPDIVFLLTITWALNSSLEESVIWAFVGGIQKDLLSAAPIGTSVVSMVIIVFAIAFIRQQIYRVSIISLVWITLLGSFFSQISTLLILLLVGFQPASLGQSGIAPLAFGLSYVILPTMVYNVALVAPVYWLVRRIQQRVAREKPFFS